jgi:hypothetical protein
MADWRLEIGLLATRKELSGDSSSGLEQARREAEGIDSESDCDRNMRE